MEATIQKDGSYSAFGGDQNPLSVLSIWFARIRAKPACFSYKIQAARWAGPVPIWIV